MLKGKSRTVELERRVLKRKAQARTSCHRPVTHGRAAAPRHREYISGTLCANCPTWHSPLRDMGQILRTSAHRARLDQGRRWRMAISTPNVFAVHWCHTKIKERGKMWYLLLCSLGYAVLFWNLELELLSSRNFLTNIYMSIRNLMLYPNLTVKCFRSSVWLLFICCNQIFFTF